MIHYPAHDLPLTIRDLIAAKVRCFRRRSGCWHFEQADLEQELAVHYLKRTAALDPRKAESHAYLSVMLDRCLASIRRRRRARKRSGHRTVYLEESGGRGDALAAIREPRIDLTLDLAGVLERLPARPRKLALMLLTRSKSQTARERGVPRTTQEGEIRALRILLERAGLWEYLGAVTIAQAGQKGKPW